MGIENEREAQRLVMAALNWTSLLFFEHLQLSAQPLSGMQLEKIEAVFQRRLQREPLSRILGVRGFWKEVFFLSPFTLDPRPETEGVIEWALSFFSQKPPPQKIIDLGTGTGCLLLSLLQEFPTAWGVGVDCQEGAILTAQKNAAHLQLTARSSFVVGDWMSMLLKGASFDLIVSNPPYISSKKIPFLEREVKDHDPLIALDGGEDGLTCYRHIIPQASQHLSPMGCLILEIGEDQGQRICDVSQSFFSKNQVYTDLNGKERYIVQTF